jgi:hypothetical protein
VDADGGGRAGRRRACRPRVPGRSQRRAR